MHIFVSYLPLSGLYFPNFIAAELDYEMHVYC